MNVPNDRPAHTGKLARWAWIAVALTPAGWVLGIAPVFLSGDGRTLGIGVLGLSLETWGVLLSVAVPVAAVVLAVKAARAGYRSGRIAVTVSGALLLATLALALLFTPLIGVIAVVVTALIFVSMRSRGNPSPPTARPHSTPTA
jgi:hypothetical protein